MLFGVVLVHATFYAPIDGINLPASVAFVDKASLLKTTTNKSVIKIYPTTYPQKLRIPLIKVNAKIQYVGITKKGKMATPNNFSDVGWFQYGIIPGEKGSAVIAGHVDNGLAFPAVFSKLEKLSVGDDIYIDQISGNTLHFKVINIKNYDAEAKTEEIFNQNDGNFLKLITCTGLWSEQLRTHNQRLVVTAEEVSTP